MPYYQLHVDSSMLARQFYSAALGDLNGGFMMTYISLHHDHGPNQLLVAWRVVDVFGQTCRLIMMLNVNERKSCTGGLLWQISGYMACVCVTSGMRIWALQFP